MLQILVYIKKCTENVYYKFWIDEPKLECSSCFYIYERNITRKNSIHSECIICGIP